MPATFLVCNDGSGASLRVLPHAARLAEASGARIVLARALNPWLDPDPTKVPPGGDAAGVLAAGWRAELQEELRAAGVEGEAMVIRMHRDEDVHAAILRAAREQDAAMVAMHSRGAGPVRRALVGSVALGILGTTHLPVMLTGQHAIESAGPGAGGYHLLGASDGSPGSNAVFLALAPLLSGLRGRVTLVRVIAGGETAQASPEAARAQAQLEVLCRSLSPLADAQMLVEPQLPREDTASAILRVAEGGQADAIALGTRGHGVLRQAIMGSTALTLLGKSPLPLVLVRS